MVEFRRLYFMRKSRFFAEYSSAYTYAATVHSKLKQKKQNVFTE